jgi:hypothetical protein
MAELAQCLLERRILAVALCIALTVLLLCCIG